MTDHALTIRQVAEYLQVTERTIYKLAWEMAENRLMLPIGQREIVAARFFEIPAEAIAQVAG